MNTRADTAPSPGTSLVSRLIHRAGFADERDFILRVVQPGLVGLIESLAVELAPQGVTVNCVCPVGCPTTGMGQEVLDWKIRRAGATPDEITAATARTNPLGRNATEADVAEAVMFFLSDEASFLTGVALDVDGGAHLGFFPGTS